MMRKIKFVVAFLFLLIILDFLYFIFGSINLKNDIVLSVKPGDSLKSIALKLKKNNILVRTDYFVVVGRLFGGHKVIKKGGYLIKANTSLREILKKIISNQPDAYNKFIIIEGTTYADVVRFLAQKNGIKNNEPIDINDFSLLKDSNSTSLEGILFPDTYFYTIGATNKNLITNAYKKMDKLLTSVWEKKAHNLPYKNKYEVLIMASIIEKETSKQNEKPLIAGVFINRLLKNMPLQADPTIKYALGNNYHGKVLRKHLSYHTVYNTYLNKGLPPTPICYPSKDSILAAIEPINSEFYYFVTDGVGGHVFSKTLQEHNNAIETLRKIIKYRQTFVNNLIALFDI